MDQTPILPASCLVATAVWDLDTDIEQALPPSVPLGVSTFRLLSVTS